MLITILAAVQSVASPALPVFSFRGVTAGVPVQRASLDRCDQGNSGMTMCGATDDEVAGVRAKVLTFFHDSKLSAVLVESRPANYRALRQAARATYGQPCRQGSERRTNAARGAFEVPVTTWCFATGKLTLRQHGVRVEGAELFYEDEVNAGPDARGTASS